MSREALSLDISQVVSRVVSGESIDTAERGAALAAKYPDLGMSGALIGQAIERAAGMVGMIRNAPEPPKPPPRAIEAPAPIRTAPANGAAADGHRAPKPASAPPPVLPVASQSIDDELAAAIDAEIGNLVSGHAATPAAHARPNGETRTRVVPPSAYGEPRATTAWRANVEAQAPSAAPLTPIASSEPATVERHGSFLSSFRRALFRT